MPTLLARALGAGALLVGLPLLLHSGNLPARLLPPLLPPALASLPGLHGRPTTRDRRPVERDRPMAQGGDPDTWMDWSIVIR